MNKIKAILKNKKVLLILVGAILGIYIALGGDAQTVETILDGLNVVL